MSQRHIVSSNTHSVAGPELWAGDTAVHLFSITLTGKCGRMTRFWQMRWVAVCWGTSEKTHENRMGTFLCHPPSCCLEVKAGVLVAALDHGGIPQGWPCGCWPEPDWKLRGVTLLTSDHPSSSFFSMIEKKETSVWFPLLFVAKPNSREHRNNKTSHPGFSLLVDCIRFTGFFWPMVSGKGKKHEFLYIVKN